MSEEKQPLNYQEINRQTVNQWVADGWEWGQPISHAEYQRVAQGGVPHLVLSLPAVVSRARCSLRWGPT